MELECLYCLSNNKMSAKTKNVVRFGQFLRKNDQALIQRFYCRRCSKTFSRATHDLCFRQHKRNINKQVAGLLVSGVSQRRAATILGVNRKTVIRKLIFLGTAAQEFLIETNLLNPKCKIIEFDDLETSEHTKLKPLSITLAVESKTRRILGFTVSQMPAKGRLAKLSVKKYGFRKDKRSEGRSILFKQIGPMLEEKVLIKSDENPHYPTDIRKYFPQATHETYKGRRGCIVGQGELKKIGFDPLFSLNHTCAMLRANINRLFRRTWCTTKKAQRLSLHVALYAVFHNMSLKTR